MHIQITSTTPAASSNKIHKEPLKGFKGVRFQVYSQQLTACEKKNTETGVV